MNDNKTIINAQKLAKYQAFQRQTNKILSEINNKDIAEDIKYADENVLLKTYQEAVKAMTEAIAEVDKDGHAITYKDYKERLKAEKKNVSLKLLFLGFIPGLIIFLAKWLPKKGKYKDCKQKMKNATESAMVSFLIAQPKLIQTFEESVNKFSSEENKLFMKNAIAKAKKAIQSSPKDAAELQEIITSSIKNKMTEKTEKELIKDLIYGTYDKKKMLELVNNEEINIFDRKNGNKMFKIIQTLHNSLNETTQENSSSPLQISGVKSSVKEATKTNNISDKITKEKKSTLGK